MPDFFFLYLRYSHDVLCDACEFAKHRRFSCLTSLNKGIASFMIVHADVWGPSSVRSISGYCWFEYCLLLSNDMDLFIAP